jgi:hypothetical protein
MILHVLHGAVHAFGQPLFQPQGIIIKPLRFGDSAIIKTQPGGNLFDQQCMLVQAVQRILYLINVLTDW